MHRDVAPAVVRVFRRLYAARVPIRRCNPSTCTAASDYRSIEADNTSAFNCRYVDGTTRWSEHAYGRAIDVNPIENPYVTSDGHDVARGEPAVPASSPGATGHGRRGWHTRAGLRADGWGVGWALEWGEGLPALLRQWTLRRASGRPGSNRRHSAWKADALPTELHPRAPTSVAPWIPAAWSWSPEALVGVALAAWYLLRARAGRAVAGRSSRSSPVVRCSSSRSRRRSTHSRGRTSSGSHLLQNVVLAEWAPFLLVLGLPSGLAARLDRRARSCGIVTHAVGCASRSGWRPTPSGTSRGCTTRPSTAALDPRSRSSTRATSSRGSPSGGASGRTSRTASRPGPGRVRARRVRPLGAARPAARARPRAALRLLRRRARAGVGALAARGPAARRHDDGRASSRSSSSSCSGPWFLRFLAEEERDDARLTRGRVAVPSPSMRRLV